MQSIHLIVLIHGLYGIVDNLAIIRSELEENGRDLDSHIVTYITTSFTGSHTWDGIDVNAHRAAKEVGQYCVRARLKYRSIQKWIDWPMRGRM